MPISIKPRVLRNPASFFTILRSTPIHLARTQFSRHASSAPTIVQPSFWKSLVPKPLRRGSDQPGRGRQRKNAWSKEWNPATFFIIIFLLIGSMSIQMIALRRDFGNFMRRAEVRIGLLREVVEKLQRGEEVDVEKTLGTGDEAQEKAWEEMLREIERDDILKTPKETKEAKKPKETPSLSAAPEAAKNEPKTEGTSTLKTNTTGYSSFF